MEIINPNEIGAKISTLVSESKKRFIAVSPYIGLKDWKKVLLNLERAQKRNVSIDFYYREIRDEDFHALRNIGVKLFKIPGLHTKLYFNDDEFVLTSMKIYEYSDLHSVTLAYTTKIRRVTVNYLIISKSILDLKSLIKLFFQKIFRTV